MLNPTDTAAPTKADPTLGHTPTPWRLLNVSRYEELPFFEVHGANGHSIAEINDARHDHLANAALIVRAVNSYAPLLEQLKALIDASDTVRFKLGQMGHYQLAFELAEAMDAANAVLRQARGEA